MMAWGSSPDFPTRSMPPVTILSPNPFDATRYHSLATIDLPHVLEATAHSDDGVIQGVRHRDLPIAAVQFHPESIMTIHGKALLANFLAN
jgi:anthranilate/para-aminobenzoate synthase component II